MPIVRGTVERINNPDQFGKCSMLVVGKWYSTKPEWLKVVVNKGDNVEFDDGGKNYIKQLKVVGGNTGSYPNDSVAPKQAAFGFPLSATDKGRAINRQNALTNAVNLMGTFLSCGKKLPTSLTDSANEVVEVARIFESYTTGDSDMEEVEKALKEMSEE